MMSTNIPALKTVLEAVLLAAGQPLSLEKLESLFGDPAPSREELHEALMELGQDCANRGIELREVASGFRLQVRSDLAPWVSRLWEEKPARYSRALLETLALIAYRQPISRAEIEDVRGVAVSTHIIKTLQDREWIRVVGHREVPGRPALYGTTRQFLDYFNLRGLEDLPPLSAVRDLEEVAESLDQLLESQAVQALAEAREAGEEGEPAVLIAMPSEAAAESGAEESAESHAVEAAGEAFESPQAPSTPDQETAGEAESPAATMAASDVDTLEPAAAKAETDTDAADGASAVTDTEAQTESEASAGEPSHGFKPPRTANG